LPRHYSAADFVAWYNGHPDFADRSFDLTHEGAVIIGNGNVAIDVARVLLLGPDELAETDIADHALNALSQNNIKDLGAGTPVRYRRRRRERLPGSATERRHRIRAEGGRCARVRAAGAVAREQTDCVPALDVTGRNGRV